MVIATGTLSVNGKVVGTVVDYEEVDGWIASKRGDDGEWTKWRRRDRASVERWGKTGPRRWVAFPPPVGRGESCQLLRDAKGRARTWAAAQAARRAVDKEFPVRALAATRRS